MHSPTEKKNMSMGAFVSVMPSGADITALITTYNQNLESTLLSIASAALQEQCKVQIVVADDHSRIDYSEAFAYFFDYLGFTNYRFVRHDNNLKTVRNISEALTHANAPFVKCFGAGDLLFSSTTLYDVVNLLSGSGSSGGFGQILSFTPESTGGTYFNAPRDAASYRGPQSDQNRHLFFHQMLYADWIPGGCQFFATDRLRGLLRTLANEFSVQYCEDFAMTLMLREEVPCFLEEPILWYDFGGGISTDRSLDSAGKLYRDHSNFYSGVAHTKPFGSALLAARFGFALRKFIAFHTPLYQALRARAAWGYQQKDNPVTFNSFYIECHELVNTFLSRTV